MDLIFVGLAWFWYYNQIVFANFLSAISLIMGMHSTYQDIPIECNSDAQ